MKKLLLAAAILSTLTACSKVEVGTVGVKVHLLGGDKGVDTEQLTPGRYWIGVNEELYTFPTFMQNYTWTKSIHEGRDQDESITFQTKEGLSVNADIGITYTLQEDKIPLLFQKYRKGINEITDVYLRNLVRDAINTESSKYVVHITMKAIERRLTNPNFLRAHRSFIVRKDKIIAIEDHHLILKNDKKAIPVGGLYKHSVYDALNLI
mgnify:CR=1 FL=1